MAQRAMGPVNRSAMVGPAINMMKGKGQSPIAPDSQAITQEMQNGPGPSRMMGQFGSQGTPMRGVPRMPTNPGGFVTLPGKVPPGMNWGNIEGGLGGIVGVQPWQGQPSGEMPLQMQGPQMPQQPTGPGVRPPAFFNMGRKMPWQR